jgi:hypothetical protein
MYRVVISLVCGALLLSCASGPKPAPRVYSADNPAKALFVVNPLQDALLGPNPFIYRGYGVVVVYPELGLSAGLTLLDAVVRKHMIRKNDALAEGAANHSEEYPFSDRFSQGLDYVDDDGEWRIGTVEYADVLPEDRKDRAPVYFDGFDEEFVVFLRPTFFVSKKLDQLRLNVDVEVYQRPAYVTGNPVHVSYKRSYDYVSVSRGEVLRKFEEGEKEQQVAELKGEFTKNCEGDAWGEVNDEYCSALKDRIGDLRFRSRITPVQAFGEAWPVDELEQELDRSIAHVVHMMRHDLKDLYLEDHDQSGYQRIKLPSWSGGVMNRIGVKLAGHERNEIWRTHQGEMFSIPCCLVD